MRSRFIVLCFLIALIHAGCSKQPPRPAEGIFLAEGGVGYVELREGPSGPQVVRGSYWGGGWDVERRPGGGLRLIQTTGWEGVHRVFDLIPGAQEGDWDLSAMDHGTKSSEAKLRPLATPVPSWLHLLNDERVIRYFEILDATGERTAPELERMGQLARGLMDTYPEDLFVRTFQVDALTRARDLDSLEALFESSKNDYWDARNPIFRHIMLNLEWNLRALRLSRSGNNGGDFLFSFFRPGEGGALRSWEEFPDILRYQQTALVHPPIGGRAPDLAPLVTLAKRQRLESLFALVQGDRQKSLQIATALYWLGQQLNVHPPVLVALGGMAIRREGQEALEYYFRAARLGQKDLELYWEVLSRLYSRQRVPPDEELLSLEVLPVIEMKPDMRRVTMRRQTLDARFEALRMAVSAQYRKIEEGRFPEIELGFPFFSETGLPGDPFSRGAMRFVERQGEFFCYSVGPDGRDDRAESIYDSSWGLYSQGDIVVAAPPVSATDVSSGPFTGVPLSELKRDLPIDPFARGTGESANLKIVDGGPSYLLSCGPDGDYDVESATGSFTPEFLYDPTNGVHSSGDIFLRIGE